MRPVTYVTGYSPSQHDIVSAHLPPRDQCKTPVASCHVPLFFPWQLWNSYTIDKFSTKPQIAAKTAMNSANLALWVKPCTDARVDSGEFRRRNPQSRFEKVIFSSVNVNRAVFPGHAVTGKPWQLRWTCNVCFWQLPTNEVIDESAYYDLRTYENILPCGINSTSPDCSFSWHRERSREYAHLVSLNHWFNGLMRVVHNYLYTWYTCTIPPQRA